MKLFRKNKSVISWLTVIAMLLSSLAPLISYAMAAANKQATPWMQICSVSGIKYIPLALTVKIEKNNKSDNNPKPVAMEHCAYCANHAHSYAVLNDYDHTIHNLGLNYILPDLFYQSHSPLFAWASSNPRGPPYSS